MSRLPTPLKPLWPFAKRVYTVGTRALAPLTVALSKRRGGYLPTAAALTVDEALVTGRGELHVVRPAETITRAVPQGEPTALATFAAQTRAEIRRQAVAVFPGGRVLGPHRAVITGDGVLIDELTRYFGTKRPREHPVFLHPFPQAPERLSGSLAVLASRGDANYYHFLVDVLPRIATVERCAELAAPDRWYLPQTTRFQRELAALVGLPADRIVDSDAVEHIEAERLVVPTVPDLDLETPAWLVNFLRERLLPPGAGRIAGRNIYLTRGDVPHTRRVLNEAALLDAVAGYGFEVVNPAALSVAEQIRTFAEADLILAPHGAALANLAFASPGAKVLELFPPDFVQGCYWKLAGCVPGVSYRYAIAAGRMPRGEMTGVTSDIDIDPMLVRRGLERLSDQAAVAR